jgi:cytoskeletal protein CcmA (bactofilin family)
MGWKTKAEKQAATRDEMENILGRTSLFRGDFSADGAFRIDGWIEGSVESRSEVVIGESGAVRGNVRGTDVVVAGQVFGNVVCSGHLEILAKGKVEGDIDAQSVRIETGGIFRGTSRMGQDGQPALQEPTQQSILESTEVPAYGCELSPAT